MLQTKAKTLVPKASEKLGVSEALMNDVVDFYYTLVRKKIENLEPVFYIHSLGTIRLSRNKLRKNIEQIESKLSSNKQEVFRKVILFNLSKEELKLKKKALENCNTYYAKIDEKRNKIMEIKRSDSGRNQE